MTMASNLGSATPRAWSEPAQGGLMQDGVLRESGAGVGMARDRGAAMLGAFVEGLGTGDVRATRARFEQVVRDHLGVAFVRFRECGASAVIPDIDPGLAVTKVSSGGRTFALELPRPTRAAQDQAWHALVSTAGQIGAIVAEIERTAGYRVAVATLADRDGNRLHGVEPAGPGGAAADRPHRPHRLHRADRRRERRRQGAGGAADPPVEPAQSRPLRRGQLRGDRRVAARGRAVRHRGSHGDRRARTARQARTGQRRLAVPRRGRRPVAGRAGQAAARAAGVLGRAGRRTPDQEGRHPDHGGDQPQPVGARDQGAVPRRSLLPPECARAEGAAAAGAARGHPRPRAGLPRAARGRRAGRAGCPRRRSRRS